MRKFYYFLGVTVFLCMAFSMLATTSALPSGSDAMPQIGYFFGYMFILCAISCCQSGNYFLVFLQIYFFI